MRQLRRSRIHLAALSLTLGAILLPAGVARAQTPPPADSARSDSATTAGKASGKRSRFAAARAKLGRAASVVEEKTGVSKETVAKAALTATPVGAAAMLARPDTSGSLTSRLGGAALRGAVAGRARKSAAEQAAASAAASAATAATGEAYRQQLLQAYGARPPATAAMGGAVGSPGMTRAQQQYMQLVTRASSGDAGAMRQLQRFQLEMSDAAMRLQGVAPAKQQQFYETAMEQALLCATSGQGCHTKMP